MHLPAFSSLLLGVVMILVVFGGTGLYFLVRKKRTGAAAEPKNLGILGFLPAEGVRSHGIGKILFIDERDALGNPSANLFECNGLTVVTTRMTTCDRLLVEVNGQRMWFDATARPVIRRIGRIMQRDTTGVLDLLANQTETTEWFIRDGKQTPPSAGPKRQYNGQSAFEDVYVVELIAPCRPALRFEAVESVANALCQFAQAPVKATMEIPVYVPMQPPAHAHRSSHPLHYTAPMMHGHGHHSSRPPHSAAPVGPVAPVAQRPSQSPSQSRRSAAPSAHAVIRRSQPSQAVPAVQVMPSSFTQPIAPQMAQYTPPQPPSMLPPPLPQYYVERFTPTLRSPQFSHGSYAR